MNGDGENTLFVGVQSGAKDEDIAVVMKMILECERYVFQVFIII